MQQRSVSKTIRPEFCLDQLDKIMSNQKWYQYLSLICQTYLVKIWKEKFQLTNASFLHISVKMSGFVMSKIYIWQNSCKQILSEWWNQARQWCQNWPSIYCREHGEEEMWAKKPFPTFPPSPFVPLFPDIRTMAGLAFLLSCQRLHTKKFPLLALLHSIKSSKTFLFMFSTKSMVGNLVKLKFSFSDFNLFRIIKQQSLTVAFISLEPQTMIQIYLCNCFFFFKGMISLLSNITVDKLLTCLLR